MSETICPTCNHRFDNRRDNSPEWLRGRLTYGPERLIVNAKLNSAAMDVCPSCGSRFATDNFRFISEFVRMKLRSMGAIYGLVALMIALAFAFAFK
jgi:hypothetical protein